MANDPVIEALENAHRRIETLEEAADFALSTIKSLDPHGKWDGQTLQAKELLIRALDSREDEGDGWWRECHDCGEVMRVYESDPPTCGACDSENVTDDPYRGCGPPHADEPEHG